MTRDEVTGEYSPTPPDDYKNHSTVAPYWKEFIRIASEDDFKVKITQFSILIIHFMILKYLHSSNSTVEKE